jgi:hypothetical protein
MSEPGARSTAALIGVVLSAKSVAGADPLAQIVRFEEYQV